MSKYLVNLLCKYPSLSICQVIWKLFVYLVVWVIEEFSLLKNRPTVFFWEMNIGHFAQKRLLDQFSILLFCLTSHLLYQNLKADWEDKVVTTPTQPQHNLNWVGFDVIMTLHTTHPTHPNSTSITSSLKSTYNVTWTTF